MDGYTYAEPLETELGIMIQILVNHLDEMINQEGRNIKFKAKKSSNMPSAVNTKSCVVKARIVPPPLKSANFSVSLRSSS